MKCGRDITQSRYPLAVLQTIILTMPCLSPGRSIWSMISAEVHEFEWAQALPPLCQKLRFRYAWKMVFRQT